MPRLAVHQLPVGDIYKDIIRINKAHRIDNAGEAIKEGRICLVRVNEHKCLAVLRGFQDSNAQEIRMDDYTRDKLKLAERQAYDFKFQQAGFVGQLRWAWNATEIGYQIASRLSVLGFVAGFLGLALGLTELFARR